MLTGHITILHSNLLWWAAWASIKLGKDAKHPAGWLQEEALEGLGQFLKLVLNIEAHHDKGIDEPT